MYVNIELWCETSHVTWEHFDPFGWWGPSSVSTNLSYFVGRFVQSIVCSFPSLTGRNRNSVWGWEFCFPVLLGGSFPILRLVLTHTDWTSLCCECWRGDCERLYSSFSFKFHENTACMAFLGSQLHCFDWGEDLQTLPAFPCLHCSWKLTPGRKLGSHRVPLVSACLSGTTLLVAWYSVSWKLCCILFPVSFF